MFIYFFSILLFFLLLIGETQVSIIVYSLFALLYLLNIDKLKVFKKKLFLNFLSAFFLTYLFVHSFFSYSPIHGLNRFLVLLFGFLSFYFFKNLDFKKFNSDIFLKAIISVFKLLSVFVFCLLIFPQLRLLIPGKNLLYASYGHNYFANILLLILPFYWQQLIKSKTNKFWDWFYLAFFYLLILLSFSRIVLFLSCLQLFVIYFFLKKNRVKIRKKLKRSIITISLILFSIFIGMFLLSFKSAALKTGQPAFFNKFSKNIYQEDRNNYWKLAIKLFREKPIFGYGLDTFGLKSYSRAHGDVLVSRYVHNEFLQFFVDTGITGGLIFAFLMLILLLQVWKKVKNDKKLSVNFSLFLALMAVYLNALLDFNWQFSAIYLLTMIFLALVLNNSSKRELKQKNEGSRNFLVLKLVNYLYVLLGVAYFFSQIFYRLNLSNLAFFLFPLREKYDCFWKRGNFSQANKELSFQIYQNNPYFLEYILRHEDDKTLEARACISLSEITPQFLLSNNLIDSCLSAESLKTAEKNELIFVVTTWAIKEKNYLISQGLSLNAQQEDHLAILILALADQAFVDKNYSLAGKAYYHYYLLKKYQPADYFPQFLTVAGGIDYIDFLKEFKLVDVNLFNQHSELFSDFFQKTILAAFNSGKVADFEILTQNYFSSQYISEFYRFNQKLVDFLLRNFDLIETESGKFDQQLTAFVNFHQKNANPQKVSLETRILAKKLYLFSKQKQDGASSRRYLNYAKTLHPWVEYEVDNEIY